MFRDILVNAIVGKTRQGVRNFVNMDFRFLCFRGFRQAQNRVDNTLKLALVEKLSRSSVRS